MSHYIPVKRIMVNANSNRLREGLGKIRNNKWKIPLQNVNGADSHTCQVKTVDVCPLDFPPLSRKQKQCKTSVREAGYLRISRVHSQQSVPTQVCVCPMLASCFPREGLKWEKDVNLFSCVLVPVFRT